MRRRLLASAAALAAVTAVPTATAEGPARLDARHRTVLLRGHLEGASTYGPFYPLGGPAFDRTCVGSGCRDHELVIVIRQHERASLEWTVQAPATGPGVDLRILDAEGRDMTRRVGGTIGGLPAPTTSTHGSVRGMPPGRYTVRVSVMAGATDYVASLRLTAP